MAGLRLSATEHQIKRAIPPVPDMRAPDGSDGIGMVARSKPIEQLGANCPALIASVGRINGSFPPCDHQHQPRTHGPRLIQSARDPVIRTVQRVPVQIERIVGRNLPGFQLPVPV